MAAYLVLSEPPAGVSAEAFNEWYDIHVREILGVPGFVSAERFLLRFVRSSSGESIPFTYYVRYEIEGPFEDAWAGLRKAVDSGQMYFPDWFPRMSASGWECMPVASEARNV